MELMGSLFLVLAVTFLVGLFISRPFFSRKANSALSVSQVDTNQAERQRSALLAEQDRILIALQDLEFDHTLGKIPAEDYPEYRANLMREGAEAMRKLDAMQPASAASKFSAEDRLEAAVAARRADARIPARQPSPAGAAVPVEPPPARRSLAVDPGDEVEALVSARRRARPEKAAGFCSKCGKPVLKSDKFCPRCGATI